MVIAKKKIFWSNQAKESLHSIYEYYKQFSLQGATNVKDDLLQSPKTIVFAKQFQLDDINPKYRRIIVRDYKVLYLEEKDIIQIIDIISCRQAPSILQNK